MTLSNSCRPSLRRRLAATLTVLLLAASATLLATAPAQAAVRHLGFHGGSGAGSGWLGDVETAAGSGVYAYCVDPYGLFPDGATGGTGLVASIPGTTPTANPGHNGTQTVSGSDIAKLNYALWNWGDADTDVEAAAMDAYVYTLTSSDHPGTGVDWFIDIRVDEEHRAAVKQRYRAIVDDVERHWNDAESLAAQLSVTVTDAAGQRAYIDVSMTPASATGTLTLTRATQDGTGATTLSVANGDRIAVTGVPTATHSYSIGADLEATGPYSYAKNVHLYTTPVNDQNQRTIRHGERSQPSVATHAESDQLSVDFSPVVATAVSSQLVRPGDAFVDDLTVYAASGTWFPGASVSGEYTIYGPFPDQPAPAAAVPAGAPVAATGRSTFTAPGTTSVSSASPAALSGWYTWVWTIDGAAQDTTTQSVLPAGYSWQSVFADAPETSAVPFSVSIQTATVEKTVGLYRSVTDAVTVGHDGSTGSWWTTGGAPVVVTLDGTAYWVPGDTEPVQSEIAPADAVSLGTVALDVSAPGTYPSPSAAVPASTAGYVVWQWAVHPDARILEHTEPWGAPGQVTRVLPPTVTTTAPSGVAPGRAVSDVAHIDGPAPAAPTALVFEAYRQSMDTPTCTADTRVADTHDAPVAVTASGDYPSPTVTFDRTGRYLWIATLLGPDGSVITAGTCGASGETTDVVPFTVTTNAVATVTLGEAATDIATVTGPTPPGASLVFRAYRLADAAHPVCDASSLVHATTPIAIDGAGDYASEPVTFADAASYAWVETAYDAAGTAVAEGTCGEEKELTTVTAAAAAPTATPTPAPTPTAAGPEATTDVVAGPPAPPTPSATPSATARVLAPGELARTGSPFDPVLGGALAAGLLVAAVVLLLLGRRRGTTRRP